MYEFNVYGRFDPETALRLRVAEADKLREAGRMLIEEGIGELRRAKARVTEGIDLAAAFRASGEQNWRSAPAMFEQSELLARAWNTRVRSPGSSFFVPEILTGRTLTVAGDGGGAVGVEVPTVGVPNAANSFLGLCTTIRPTGPAGDQQIPRFDSLPSVTVLANETAQAADAPPAVSASTLSPTNLSSYVTSSRQWTLQARGGAEAVQRALLAALRTQAQVQIIDGAGSGGEVLGLVNDTTITSADGTNVDWSAICDALEAVEAAAGDAPLTWVVTAPAATILRQREKAAGSGVILDDGRIGGYPAIVIGGTTSAHAVFGRWQDLIVHEWTPLELAVNPFAVFRADVIGVRGWFSFNAAPLVAASFYCVKDIT